MCYIWVHLRVVSGRGKIPKMAAAKDVTLSFTTVLQKSVGDVTETMSSLYSLWIAMKPQPAAG